MLTGTKGRMVRNVDWKKRWMEKTPIQKNAEWDKTLNGTKCQMGKIVEWKTKKIKNVDIVEWDKTSNIKYIED